MRYAELYRVPGDHEVPMFHEKLVGGHWVPNGEMAKVASFGIPLDEAEAREFAGDDWPADE